MTYKATFKGGTIPHSVEALRDLTPDDMHLSFDSNAVHDNSARASWAAEALVAFSDRVSNGGEPLEIVVSDLLCDLRHLCDAIGVDFGDVNDRALCDYEDEIAGVY